MLTFEEKNTVERFIERLWKFHLAVEIESITLPVSEYRMYEYLLYSYMLSDKSPNINIAIVGLKHKIKVFGIELIKGDQ